MGGRRSASPAKEGSKHRHREDAVATASSSKASSKATTSSEPPPPPQNTSQGTTTTETISASEKYVSGLKGGTKAIAKRKLNAGFRPEWLPKADVDGQFQGQFCCPVFTCSCPFPNLSRLGTHMKKDHKEEKEVLELYNKATIRRNLRKKGPDSGKIQAFKDKDAKAKKNVEEERERLDAIATGEGSGSHAPGKRPSSQSREKSGSEKDGKKAGSSGKSKTQVPKKQRKDKAE